MGNVEGRELTPEEARMKNIKSMDWEMKQKFQQTGVKYNSKRTIFVPGYVLVFFWS